MASYKYLINNPVKTRKNFWYIYGEDSALVTDAYNLAKLHSISGVSSTCLGVFNGEQDNISSVDEFIQRPYYEERKLVVVYNPIKFSGIKSIITLSDPSTFFVLVDYDGCSDDLIELTKNNTKAKLVECSKAKNDDLKSLITSRLNIEKSAVEKLLALGNNDSEWILNKISILEFFDVDEITLKMVDLICTDQGLRQFESSLIEFDKRACFRYIKDKGVEEISTYKIKKDLHNLSLLNSVSVEHGKQTRAIADKTGLTKKEIELYSSNISNYDLTTSKKCFNLLMSLNTELRNKNRFAFVALVCGW